MTEPTGRKTITVHKEGAEGAIQVDGDTGLITTSIHDRPDWSAGLACALLVERRQFYTSRLGEKAAAGHLAPDGIALQDLGWIGVDETTGDECELEADGEYRMEIVAKVLGIDREDEDFGETIAEVEITADTTRSAEDVTLMDEGMKQTFGQTGEAAQKQAQGD